MIIRVITRAEAREFAVTGANLHMKEISRIGARKFSENLKDINFIIVIICTTCAGKYEVAYCPSFS